MGYAFDDRGDLRTARKRPLQRKVVSGVVPYLELRATHRRRKARQEINIADLIAGSDEQTQWHIDLVEPSVRVPGEDYSRERLAV
jgi:hypothetical protein